MLLGTEINLWRELFRKFDTVVRLSPWKWFGGNHCFAIHPHGEREPVFVHNCERVLKGLNGFILIRGWNAEALYRQIISGSMRSNTRSLEIPYVLCAMHDAKALTANELHIISSVGMGIEGKDKLPVFVSNRLGWMPWHLSKSDVALSIKVLDQALGVFLRGESAEDDFLAPHADRFWVRRQLPDGKWEEGFAQFRPFVEFGHGRSPELSDDLIKKVLALPADLPPIEIGFDIIPKIALLSPEAVPTRGEDGRIPLGYFFGICPYGTEKVSGASIENGVFYPLDDIGSLHKFFPNLLSKVFIKKGHRPKEIVVSSLRMMNILRPLQLLVPFKMTLHEKLPNYEQLFKMVSKVVSDRVK